MANIAARPQKKRAIGLAMNNSLGNLALVWTPYLYPDSAGPRYTTGKQIKGSSHQLEYALTMKPT